MFLRRPRSQQTWPLRIDHANPLARGLVFAVVPVGLRWVDLVSGMSYSESPTNVDSVVRRPSGGAAAHALMGNVDGGGSFASQTGLDRLAGPCSVFVEGSAEDSSYTLVSTSPDFSEFAVFSIDAGGGS